MENSAQPTVQQLIAECHARIRRMMADQVYLGSVLDLLGSDIVEREKATQELRDRLSALEEKYPG